MIAAGSILGLNITLAYPDEPGLYDVDSKYVEFAKKAVAESGGSLTIENDIWKASKDADVIYAKSWARNPIDMLKWVKNTRMIGVFHMSISRLPIKVQFTCIVYLLVEILKLQIF